MTSVDPGERPPGTPEVVIGRVGRAHGVRGEVVVVDVRTDQPEERLSVGAVVRTRGASGEEAAPRTVVSSRWHGSRLLVGFDGVTDRTAAEQLRGMLLVVEVPEGEQTGDPDEFYDYQLVGLQVQTETGREIGTVSEVIHLPLQDVLAVQRGAGSEVLVPFVRQIVPEVDLARGRIRIDPPAGLVDSADEEELQ